MEYNAIGLTKKIARNGSTLAEYSYLADGARLSALGSDGSQVPGLFDILQGIRPDPLAEKYHGHSQFGYCAGDPVNRFDSDGQIWDTIVDVVSVVYDVGAATYNAVKGDKEKVRSHIKDAGVDIACAFIPFLSSASGKAIKYAAKGVDAIRLTKEIQKFEKASEFGIDSYKSLTKAVAEKYGKESGLEVHHLIEQRLAKAWGMNVDEIPSVVLTKEEHQVFTNKWRKEIGYINSKAEINTGNASREQVIEAAKEVYKDYPEFLKVLKIQ